MEKWQSRSSVRDCPTPTPLWVNSESMHAAGHMATCWPLKEVTPGRVQRPPYHRPPGLSCSAEPCAPRAAGDAGQAVGCCGQAGCGSLPNVPGLTPTGHRPLGVQPSAPLYGQGHDFCSGMSIQTPETNTKSSSQKKMSHWMPPINTKCF